MKYEITYNTKYGHGNVIVNGNENDLNAMILSLQDKGCRDITYKFVREYDPCDHCNKPCCYGCEHQE